MASLKPAPGFGAVRYRHGRSMWPILVVVAILTLLAFMPSENPNAGDPKPVLLSFAALGLAFYLYPRLRPTDVVTTSPEGIELRTFIGSRRTFVAWNDVQAVVLWKQPAGRTRHDLIGIERVPGAPPLARELQQGAFTRSIDAAILPPGVSLALSHTSVAAGRIDLQALANLIARASAVLVVDARNPQEPRHLHPTGE
jgi:hypothetical protein